MSQGGQGMFTPEPAVTVIGSDGKMYSGPSAARAAGAYPESRSYDQPVPMPGLSVRAYPESRSYDQPVPMPGLSVRAYPESRSYDQPVPMPGISAGGKGGGMFTPEPAVTVIGSDGKMYSGPSAARAAGAYPESRSYDQPVPMPGISAGAKGGGDPYSQRPMPPDFMPMPGNDFTPMPGISAGAKGGANPYSQIMGQNGGGDPYSQIMGQMPTLQNPYATSTNEPFGGYDPRIYNNAFVGSNSRLNLSGLIGGGGGGDATTNSGWDNMTPAEKAGYYSQNPTMGAITRAGQMALGYTTLGALQNLFNPSFVAQQNVQTYGYAPENYFDPGWAVAADAAAAAQQNNNNVAAGLAVAADAEAAAGAANAATNEAAGLAAAADAESAAGSTVSNASDNSASNADGTSSGMGTEGGGDGWAIGGKVTKNRLKGPDPKGPDEGYGALLSGEYVIKKSAVDKYGTGLLNMINNGKIPAKKIKSLLG